MTKVKLYWEFYKSTLILNFGFSLVFSLIFALAFSMATLAALIKAFPICFMTGGPFISLFYKEISKKNEYYFYYNKGISKINLIIVSFVLSGFIGIILLNILPDVKPFRD